MKALLETGVHAPFIHAGDGFPDIELSAHFLNARWQEALAPCGNRSLGSPVYDELPGRFTSECDPVLPSAEYLPRR